MTDKKESTKETDLAAENAALREALARAEGRAEGRAESGASSGLDARQGHILDVALTSILDIPDKFGLQPLPQRWVALQERGSWTCAIYLCTLGTKSPHYRLTKISWPDWLPADQGPAVRPHEDAQRVVDMATLRGFVPEMHRREAILSMQSGEFRAERSSFSYDEIAASYHELFGHGKRGDHARMTRLHQPVRRLAGLLTEEARHYCTYFEFLEENQPIPQAWFDLLLPTGKDVVAVYEVEAPIPAPPAPPQEYKPRPPPAPFPRY